MGGPPQGYVEVSERIEAFYAKHPEGSLRCKEIRTVEIGGQSFLVYVAQAFRSPDDQAPAEGAAWEPVPGKTNFTRDSELMNAETSAWGRAIAALGFEVKRGIGSANEIRNRAGNGGGPEDPERIASEKQRNYVANLMDKADFTADQLSLIRKWSRGERGLKAAAASFLIENLRDGTAEGRSNILTTVGFSDTPADTSDLDEPEGEQPSDEDLPPF